jgi:hypothetical protein
MIDEATLVAFVRAPRSMGVERYSSYVTNGYSGNFDSDVYTVGSPRVHEALAIADTKDREEFSSI